MNDLNYINMFKTKIKDNVDLSVETYNELSIKCYKKFKTIINNKHVLCFQDISKKKFNNKIYIYSNNNIKFFGKMSNDDVVSYVNYFEKKLTKITNTECDFDNGLYTFKIKLTDSIIDKNDILHRLSDNSNVSYVVYNNKLQINNDKITKMKLNKNFKRHILININYEINKNVNIILKSDGYLIVNNVKIISEIPNIIKFCYNYLNIYDYIKPDKYKIIIQTLEVFIGYNQIDLRDVANNIILSNDGILAFKCQKKKDNFHVCKQLFSGLLESEKCFNNQITLLLYNDRKDIINVKLFQNCKMHITGCKRQQDCVKVANKAKTILKNIFAKVDKNILINDDISLRVFMINSKFNCNIQLNRELLFIKLKLLEKYDDSILLVTFNKDRYQGINLKYKGVSGKCSILIFRSGQILITGAKSNEDLNNAYIYITRVIKENYTKVKCNYYI